MAEFQKGDVVQLKSGGPLMTVADLADYSQGMGLGPKDGVKCVWFDVVKGIRKPQEEVFDAVVLNKHQR